MLLHPWNWLVRPPSQSRSKRIPHLLLFALIGSLCCCCCIASCCQQCCQNHRHPGSEALIYALQPTPFAHFGTKKKKNCHKIYSHSQIYNPIKLNVRTAKLNKILNYDRIGEFRSSEQGANRDRDRSANPLDWLAESNCCSTAHRCWWMVGYCNRKLSVCCRIRKKKNPIYWYVNMTFNAKRLNFFIQRLPRWCAALPERQK